MIVIQQTRERRSVGFLHKILIVKNWFFILWVICWLVSSCLIDLIFWTKKCVMHAMYSIMHAGESVRVTCGLPAFAFASCSNLLWLSYYHHRRMVGVHTYCMWSLPTYSSRCVCMIQTTTLLRYAPWKSRLCNFLLAKKCLYSFLVECCA